MNLKYYLGRILVRLFGFKNKFSYSQLNEDNVIDWLTGYKEKGTYIDIGAYHPDKISNTKLFYERGWRGINIEPSPIGYKLFCEKRLEDINLNCAVGEGEVEYFGDENESSGATCVKELAAARGITKSRKIKLKPLREIFAENNLRTVDFMTIDVENFEEAVLKSNDWSRYQAAVICLEGGNYKFLKQFGYRLVFWDGNNSYLKLKTV
ncbi:FkbM family methyltransferase [Patescibacteria group bacterium]|nr:MAG: FkbM family methyltransferase [Patescibacteria group bacterium]